MHPESDNQHSIFEPEYRSFIKTRGKLAIVNIDMYAQVVSQRLNDGPAEDESIEIALRLGEIGKVFLEELKISVPLTNSPLLFIGDRIEYNHLAGISDHKLPRIATTLWYISHRIRQEITPHKAKELRAQGNGLIKSLDSQTTTQIAERFKSAIYGELRKL